MKKLVSILIIAALMLGIAACGLQEEHDALMEEMEELKESWAEAAEAARQREEERRNTTTTTTTTRPTAPDDDQTTDDIPSDTPTPPNNTPQTTTTTPRQTTTTTRPTTTTTTRQTTTTPRQTTTTTIWTTTTTPSRAASHNPIGLWEPSWYAPERWQYMSYLNFYNSYHHTDRVWIIIAETNWRGEHSYTSYLVRQEGNLITLMDLWGEYSIYHFIINAAGTMMTQGWVDFDGTFHEYREWETDEAWVWRKR